MHMWMRMARLTDSAERTIDSMEMLGPLTETIHPNFRAALLRLSALATNSAHFNTLWPSASR